MYETSWYYCFDSMDYMANNEASRESDHFGTTLFLCCKVDSYCYNFFSHL